MAGGTTWARGASLGRFGRDCEHNRPQPCHGRIVPDRGVVLDFRADFFNVLNHASFSTPGPAPGSNTDITNANFGVLTTTASTARVGQLGLTLKF